MEPTKTTTLTTTTLTTLLEDIRFYDDDAKKPTTTSQKKKKKKEMAYSSMTTTTTTTWTRRRTDARSTASLFLCSASGKWHNGKAGAESKNRTTFTAGNEGVGGRAERRGSADAVLTDNRDEDEKMVRAVFEKSNPTVAGEMFAMNEIYRRDKGGGGGGFDANAAAAEKEEEGGILSRKTMEFWEAVVSRIEFEYENEMKKTMDSSQIERLDAVGYKIEAAAKRIRAQYNNFLSRYVYALDAKWKDDKENRSRSEAIDNLKLRVLLLKDAVMKRRERVAENF